MRKYRAISIVLLILITVTGVCGCMDRDKLYGAKERAESNEEYAAMMLDYIEGKYQKNFEIVKFNFPEEGFNTEHLQSSLIVRETQSGIITDVYALLGAPYTYYDNYVADLASWNSRHLVDSTILDGMGNVKMYLYLRNENIGAPDVSKENVSRVVLVVNINRKPDIESLEKLYVVYQQLFELDYEHRFLIVGFTEESEDFSNYVQAYRVYGKKKWVDFEDTVYATLSAKDAGLTFAAFQDLCEYN